MYLLVVQEGQNVHIKSFLARYNAPSPNVPNFCVFIFYNIYRVKVDSVFFSIRQNLSILLPTYYRCFLPFGGKRFIVPDSPPR
jgi:hypothetical protein